MRPGEEDFSACERFRNEVAEKFCKIPNRFSFASFAHHLKFRQKSDQNTVKTFAFFGLHLNFCQFLHQIFLLETVLVMAGTDCAACSSKGLGTLAYPKPLLKIILNLDF